MKKHTYRAITSAAIGALTGVFAWWNLPSRSPIYKLEAKNLENVHSNTFDLLLKEAPDANLKRVTDQIIEVLFDVPRSHLYDDSAKENIGKSSDLTLSDNRSDSSQPLATAREAIQYIRQYSDEFAQHSSEISEAIAEHNTKASVADAQSFALGAVLAAIDFTNTNKYHSRAEIKQPVNEVLLRGFLWAYASALHAQLGIGRIDHMSQMLFASPELAAELLSSVSKLFKKECLQIMTALSPNANSTEIGRLYTEILRKNPELAAKAIKLTQPQDIGNILAGIGDPRGCNAGEYLGFLLEDDKIDLTRQSHALLASLWLNHRDAFSEWGLKHWDEMPRQSVGLVELALQDNAELARQLLTNPPQMKEASWKSISKHLAYALAVNDAPAFKEFVNQQPEAQREAFLDSVIALMGTRNPAQGAKMVQEYGRSFSLSQDSINTIADGLTIADSEAGQAFLKILPSEAAREASVQAILANFRVFRGDEALQLANRLLTTPDFAADQVAVDACFAAVSTELVQTSGDTDRAVEWVSHLPSQALRDQAALRLAEIWLQSDPASAAEYLLSQPPSEARKRMLEKSAEDIVDSAILASIRNAIASSP